VGARRREVFPIVSSAGVREQWRMSDNKFSLRGNDGWSKRSEFLLSRGKMEI